VFTIEVGPTDYASFLGSNLFNHARGDELGWSNFSNPVGISGTPITTDGKLLFGRRNQRVAFHGGYVHTFGGMLEAGECRVDGTIDAFAGIARELREELGLEPAEIGAMICLGLIRDPTIRQPELIFDVHLRLTAADVAGRLDLRHEDQEHSAVLACPDEPAAIVPFVRASRPMTAVAVGALCLHARRMHGGAAYEDLVRELAERQT
jgi:8-oxo-dGTP pyrophosphatase MutT (NUDIX family)